MDNQSEAISNAAPNVVDALGSERLWDGIRSFDQLVQSQMENHDFSTEKATKELSNHKKLSRVLCITSHAQLVTSFILRRHRLR